MVTGLGLSIAEPLLLRAQGSSGFIDVYPKVHPIILPDHPGPAPFLGHSGM